MNLTISCKFCMKNLNIFKYVIQYNIYLQKCIYNIQYNIFPLFPWTVLPEQEFMRVYATLITLKINVLIYLQPIWTLPRIK